MSKEPYKSIQLPIYSDGTINIQEATRISQIFQGYDFFTVVLHQNIMAALEQEGIGVYPQFPVDEEPLTPTQALKQAFDLAQEHDLMTKPTFATIIGHARKAV